MVDHIRGGPIELQNKRPLSVFTVTHRVFADHRQTGQLRSQITDEPVIELQNTTVLLYEGASRTNNLVNILRDKTTTAGDRALGCTSAVVLFPFFLSLPLETNLKQSSNVFCCSLPRLSTFKQSQLRSPSSNADEIF